MQEQIHVIGQPLPGIGVTMPGRPSYFPHTSPNVRPKPETPPDKQKPTK